MNDILTEVLRDARDYFLNNLSIDLTPMDCIRKIGRMHNRYITYESALRFAFYNKVNLEEMCLTSSSKSDTVMSFIRAIVGIEVN